jgi:hypothetical protein
MIWQRLGADIGNYVEPFCGSCAVALARPASFKGWITLNDLDGFVVNFWRSMIHDPVTVAQHAANPVIEADLHARHLHLVNMRDRLTERLMADPDYYDAKAAAWWAWGACCNIAGGWCSGDGPWVAGLDDEGFLTLTLREKGSGRQGVNRQLPHLGGGQGVNRQLPHLGGGRVDWLSEWFRELSRLLVNAHVTNGSWARVMSVGTLTRNGVAGILLDPPYSLTNEVYACDGNQISAQVREWCKANGANPALRIALCGHSGEGHEELESAGWLVSTWHKGGGYQGADDRERIWFSPHCNSELGGLFE